MVRFLSSVVVSAAVLCAPSASSTTVKFVEVKQGYMGIVTGDPNQPDHVQVRRKENRDRLPEVAVSFDKNGTIVVQIAPGADVKIRVLPEEH